MPNFSGKKFRSHPCLLSSPLFPFSVPQKTHLALSIQYIWHVNSSQSSLPSSQSNNFDLIPGPPQQLPNLPLCFFNCLPTVYSSHISQSNSFFIEINLIYNILLISGVQHNNFTLLHYKVITIVHLVTIHYHINDLHFCLPLRPLSL